MIKYKEVAKGDFRMVSKQCDFCKKVFNDNDDFKAQEFLHIDFTGGYGSRKFGDQTRVQCDICEDCLFVILNGRYKESYDGGGKSEEYFDKIYSQYHAKKRGLWAYNYEAYIKHGTTPLPNTRPRYLKERIKAMTVYDIDLMDGEEDWGLIASKEDEDEDND